MQFHYIHLISCLQELPKSKKIKVNFLFKSEIDAKHLQYLDLRIMCVFRQRLKRSVDEN